MDPYELRVHIIIFYLLMVIETKLHEFPVGTTSVTWFVEDQSGNIGECDFDVTITVATSIRDYLLSHVRIYPNPTQSALKIDLGSSYNRVLMTISDMNGKVLFREEFELIEEIENWDNRKLIDETAH